MARAEQAYDQLKLEWDAFLTAWGDSRLTWKDSVVCDFEKRFIAPLEANIPQLLNALEVLKDELEVAQRKLRS